MKKVSFFRLYSAAAFLLAAAAPAFAQEDPFPTTAQPSFWRQAGVAMRNYWLYTPDTSSHREFARDFEAGGALGAGAAWDMYLGLLDIFKKDAEVRVDFNEILGRFSAASPKGLNINIEFAITPFYFKKKNTRIGDAVFSFLNIESRLDMNLNEDFFLFFAQGNLKKHNIAPALSMSGSLFAEIVSVEFRHTFFAYYFFRLKPSWYIPLFYIPQSAQELRITAENGFKAELKGGANVYIPFSFSNGFAITSLGGADIDVIIERSIFNILDAGLELLHLPLMPSVLSTVGEIGFDGTLLNTSGISMDNLGFTIPELDQFYHTKNFWVFRPLTAGFYLLYRPFGTGSWVIRPNAGLTFLTAAGQLYINAGFETAFAPADFLSVTFFTGFREGLARNSLCLAFNWRRFGWYLKLDTRSQDYLRSWQLKGAGLSVGWYAGR